MITKIKNHETLEKFRSFLRSLMMHAGVGTALGGVMTMVGEPQNLIIAEQAKWNFIEFFLPYGSCDSPCIYLRITHLYFSRKI